MANIISLSSSPRCSC